MNPEDYAEARRLFARLCELSPAEREAAFDEEGTPDDLRESVRALLARFDADRPLEEGALGDARRHLVERAVSDASAATTAGAVPERVGAYRIERRIGEGGMGVVYAARRDGADELVALKVIRIGLASEAHRSRFLREGHVLRELRHRGIAGFLEAGEASVSNAGDSTKLPFLAMELIDGVSLHEHARLGELDDRERVELFARVCDAVHHAHGRGVVHRDLKPANILVVREGAADADRAFRSPHATDRVGQPKVLDFGVARVASMDVQTITETATGALIGTVPYMSPEQVAGEGSEVDQRSDVYSLGVLLFELLAGRLPYDVRGRPLPEAARIIREDDPTRLGSVADRLRGDLEVIVGKALEKEPRRRYQTAEDLARDLRSFVAGRPIAARPPTWGHQIGKFARRNRTLVSGVAAAFGALLVGLIATIWFALREVDARSAAEEARSVADAATEVSRLTAYRAQISAGAAALEGGDAVQARELLEATPRDLRGWEYAHLTSRLDQSLAHVEMPDRSPARFLAFTPDGDRVRVVHGQGDEFWVTTWDLGAERTTSRPIDASLRAVLIDASGEYLFACDERGESGRAWVERVDGTERRTFSSQGLPFKWIAPHPEPAKAYLSTDERVYAARASGELDPISPTLPPGHRLRLVQPWGLVTGMSRTIFSVSRDGTLRGFYEDVSATSDARRSPDGRLAGLLTRNSLDVEVWNLASAEPTHVVTLGEHQDDVTGIGFSHDGRLAATVGQDRLVRLWSLPDGEERGARAGATAQGNWVAFSPDDTRLASNATDRLYLWAAEAVDPVFTFDDLVGPAAFARNGALVVIPAWEGYTYVYDAESALPVARYPSLAERTSPDGIAIDPGGRWFALAEFVIKERGSFLRVQSLGTGQELARLPIERHAAMAVSPGGERIALATRDAALTVFESENWTRVTSELSFDEQISALCYAPDGTSLAVGREDGALLLLDADDLTIRATLAGHDGGVTSLSFHPSGATLVSGGRDQQTHVWALSGENEEPVTIAQSSRVWSICHSPDGSRLMIGEVRRVRVHDAADGGLITRMRGHWDRVTSVEFSPDGRRLLSGGGDRTVRLWDHASTAERVRSREAYRAARERVEPWVDQLLAEHPPQVVAERVRDDLGRSEREREIALQALLGRALQGDE